MNGVMVPTDPLSLNGIVEMLVRWLVGSYRCTCMCGPHTHTHSHTHRHTHTHTHTHNSPKKGRSVVLARVSP